MAVLSLSAIVSSQDLGQVYCGRKLATALAFLCDSGLVKRSEVYQNSAPVEKWPWLASYRAHSMSRRKRQVVAECCDKPCTVNELITYCF